MPIPILQYGVKVRDPTTQQFSDLAALRGGQGPTGPGVPAGGTDGDVLVKSGSADYSGEWTNTPKLMENFAPIEETRQAQNNYDKRDFLVYDGKLYFANEDISAGTNLNPGANIISTNMGYFVRRINNFLGVGNTAVNYNIDDMTVATKYSGIYFYNGYDANLQGTLPFTGAYGLFFVADNGYGGCVQIAINIVTGQIYRRQYPDIWPNWRTSN